jgi:purine nucleosidase
MAVTQRCSPRTGTVVNARPCGRVVAGLVLLWLSAATAANGTARPVIIDTDPGADDAIAIMLALNSPELEVRALTVVAGNVPGAQALDNALRLVSLAHRCDLPVAAGAQRPLTRILTTAELFHGRNGLGDVQLPPSDCAADRRWAPDLIVELVHAAPHQITLVTLGPLTNVALALSKDQSIVPLVREVIMMGGAYASGNATPVSEFNVYVDPEAAKAVFDAGWPITMVGLDVGDRAVLTREHLALLTNERGPAARLVADVGGFLLQRAARYGRAGASMYDPLAVAVAIDPNLVQTTRMRVDVETAGNLTRGQTVANRSGAVSGHELRQFPEGERYVATGPQPVALNASVATAVDSERFARLLLTRVRGR